MKFRMGLAVALVSFGTIAFADTQIDLGILPVQEKRINLSKLNEARLETGDLAGELKLELSVTYSNSCIAGTQRLSATTAVSQDRSRPEVTVLVESRHRGVRIACPMIFRPVSRTFEVVLKDLEPGVRHTVNVIGRDSSEKLVARTAEH